jgi:phosphoenolpyruvate carboxykinase (ATP)
MEETTVKSQTEQLTSLGFKNLSAVHNNLSSEKLVEKTLENSQGDLADCGALVCDTGEFTGRSPKDKFIVKDDITKDTIWWGEINQPISKEVYNHLYKRVIKYFENKEIYSRDAYACASDKYRLNLKVLTEEPWQNLFAHNLFLRPTEKELENFTSDWTIIAASGFNANPEEDGTRQHNFTIISFTKKTILIGGSAYTGEIKKGVFTVLNYILPQEKNVLSMHCSANIGENNDTAIFFGLSGTGKTTLSADPTRNLIGDDEHGWDEKSVFNFEGGCYAKCVDLTKEKEPQIFNAIKTGTLVENTCFYPNTKTINFRDTSKTENTRAAYPIHHIENAVNPSIGDLPKNIFFLTCDAFGVLPPVSKLTTGQAMYHFISGYTAKVAGTEAGITEPQTTFSACFGEPFLPLHPMKYAELLGDKIKKHGVKVWLINTGWTGGAYGVGERIELKYTRAMISAVLNGKLDNVDYKKHPIFRLSMPTECESVPSTILDPKLTWEDNVKYNRAAISLAEKFNENFSNYSDFANNEILEGEPMNV